MSNLFYGWFFGTVTASLGYLIISVGLLRRDRRREHAARQEWLEQYDDPHDSPRDQDREHSWEWKDGDHDRQGSP
jgi:hypothetical protein